MSEASEASGGRTHEVSIATRHVMQANKSKNTRPELEMRLALREAGYPGYRLHWKKCPGRPDVCYPGRKVAIFVNGCFWHRCPHCNLPSPKTNVDFWERKFARNVERDARNHAELLDAGWTVVVVWECALKRGRREHTISDVVREVELARLGMRAGGHMREAGYGRAWRRRRTWRRRRARH